MAKKMMIWMASTKSQANTHRHYLPTFNIMVWKWHISLLHKPEVNQQWHDKFLINLIC